MTERRKNLYYLDELSDYKIASDDPDVRGWDVKDKDNRVIGKVDNLLVNKDREQVVYLDVEVDNSIIEANHDPYGKSSSSEVHEFLNKDGEEHIIIPVGLVSLNEDQNFVYTDRIDYQTFSETKRFEKGSAVDRDYEVIVLESYDRFGDPEENRRDRDRYQEELRESRRRDDDMYRDRDGKGFETRPDDSYDKDFSTRENRSRDISFEDEDRPRGDYETRRRRGEFNDDDEFYDRREFDRRNYRRRS